MQPEEEIEILSTGRLRSRSVGISEYEMKNIDEIRKDWLRLTAHRFFIKGYHYL